jgi:hypothetical protein
MKKKMSFDLCNAGKLEVTELKYNKIRSDMRIWHGYLKTGSISSQAHHYITHSLSGIQMSGSYLGRLWQF